MGQTGFSTVGGMIDSTFCHCSGIVTDTSALFYASDSLNHAPFFKGDTLTIVGTGIAQVTFDSVLQKYVVNVDSVSGGGSLWTDAGAFTYLTSVTDRAVVGSSTELDTNFEFQVDGDIFGEELRTNISYITHAGGERTFQKVGSNMFFAEAGNATASGNDNYGFGNITMPVLSTGARNMAIGKSVMNLLTTGDENTGIGSFALEKITDGQSNVGIGPNAVRYNIGNYNIGIGRNALLGTSGVSDSDFNIGIGFNALEKLESGQYDIAIGYLTMNKLTSGSADIAMGRETLTSLTTGSNNTVIGYRSAQQISTAGDVTMVGSEVGYFAAGAGNVYVGKQAGYGSTGASTGTYNVGIGWRAGYALTTGGQNTFLGFGAGDATTTGSSNISIGTSTDLSGPTVSNELRIASLLYGTSINTFASARLGVGKVAPDAKVDIVGIGATSGSYALIATNSGGATATAALAVRDDNRVGLSTNAPARTLHVSGEVRITDLTTDTPTLLVGADADGDLNGVSVGTGLNLASGILSTTQTANNGLSDNEAGGGIFRLGNRYMNGSDGPFSTDRKVNIDGNSLFLGDNTDSLLMVVDGANDRVGIGRLPDQRLDILGSSGTYARVSTSGAVAISGLILNNTADANASWALYRQDDGDFGIGSSTAEWPSGTLTTPILIKPNPPDNSLYMDGSGSIALGGTTAARRFDNYGETRLRDLVTDNPTVLVGADADGDLSAVTLGSGLSFTGTTLDVSGAAFYQTFRDDGTPETQRAAANFVSSVRIPITLTDDAVNGETEISADLAFNSVANAYLSTRSPLSVMGRATNTVGDVADIASSADGQVLRRSGTSLGFGTVATAGIADDAVTYVKIQNVVNNDRVLGRISGANGVVEELTQANLYTILGFTGTANRFALWTGTNALGSDAAFTFDGANDRATFTGTVAGVGANTGILNLNSGAIAASTTFLRMSGNITNNMIAELLNANNSASTANSIFTIGTGGASAGDPMMQFVVAGQQTVSIGVDNTDSDKFKITPGGSSPGANANASFVATNTSPPLWGINKDSPGHELDVEGTTRSVQFQGTGNLWSSSNITFHAGAGTGPTINSISGGNNFFQINFTTGTTPTAGDDIFTATYPESFGALSYPVFSPRSNDDLAGVIPSLFVRSGAAGNLILDIEDGVSMPASTQVSLTFVIFGY